jgi:hypothetical protein
MLGLDPVDIKAAIITNVYLTSHDGNGETVSVSDPDELLLLSKSFDVVDRHSPSNMALIVCSPIFHEVPNVLDVNSSTWHLP